MDLEGFRHYLHDRKIPAAQIDPALAVAERFEHYLAGLPPHTPSAADVEGFAQVLIREGLNTEANFISLIRYGRFLDNAEVFRAAMDTLDGAEVVDNLYRRLGEQAGTAPRDAIFAGIELPPLGLPAVEKARLIQILIARMEAQLGPEACERILSPSLRDLPDEYYTAGRAEYLASGGFDAFLEQRRQAFVAELEQLQREGRPYFTQEVTGEMIQFVRDNPLIAQGVREGNILYVVKIPYLTQRYLSETDPQMKRYYYCHCPWARESIRRADVAVSPTFCQCSAGFVKKPWEVIFGQTLRADVVESVLKGDLVCKIAIHLPPEVV